MKIVNIDNGAVLADKATVARSLAERTQGLLNRQSLDEGEAMIIDPCNSIHTFFMRFPIDVAFVDKDNLVVKIISNMPPFRLSAVYFRASFVIELPSGVLAQTSTSLGTPLSLI